MENSTGEITFSDLMNGTYTVLVYNSEPEGSGDMEVPAIERTVTISGGTTSPSPSADTPSTTGELNTSHSTSMYVYYEIDLGVIFIEYMFIFLGSVSIPSTTAGPTDEKKETRMSDSMTYVITTATG